MNDSHPTEHLDTAATRTHSTAFHSDVDERLAELEELLRHAGDAGETGSLLLDRALLRQGSSDPTIPAADARRAFELLNGTGRNDEAALAASVAAGMMFRTDDLETAVALSVDAMLLLEGHQASTLAARAANSISLLYQHLSAFEFAYEYSERAIALLGPGPSPTRDVVGYTLCSTVVEANHSGIAIPTDTAHECVDALCNGSENQVTRQFLGPGMAVELALIEAPNSLTTFDLDLSNAESAAPRLAAWFRLVCAELEHARGDHHAAIRLLDVAIPQLAAVRDDPRLVRSHRLRSRARSAIGDVEGALADANARGDIIRTWHVAQVGRLAVQISRRAELERSRDRLRARASELAEKVDVDALTGVGSRRLLEMTLDDMSDNGDGDVAVVMIDLDHFKTVNDSLGHASGDAVLRRVGDILRATARSDDLVARLGGEEFVAVFPGVGTDRALAYADGIRAQLAATDWGDIAPGFDVRASAGVATGSVHEVRRVLERADEALYEAKRSGRDRCVMA